MRTSFFILLSCFILFSVGLFALPAAPAEAGIIPCGLSKPDPAIAGGGTAKCTLCHLIVGINEIIKLLRNIMLAVAIAVIVAMAFVYITAGGDEGRMRFAKGGITAALIGFAIILLAWVVVNFILSIRDTSGASIFNSTLIRTGWDTVTCDTTSTAR
jgi:Type IV secretion system pilin